MLSVEGEHRDSKLFVLVQWFVIFPTPRSIFLKIGLETPLLWLC